jgi:hypothetical protein
MATLSPGVRRALKASVAVGLPVGSLVVGAAGGTPAQAGTCGDRFNPVAGGNRASWTVACPGSGVEARGWVQDGHADGNCAQVRFYFPANGAWKYSPKACPEGEVRNFTVGGPGRTVNGYLFEAPA